MRLDVRVKTIGSYEYTDAAGKKINGTFDIPVLLLYTRGMAVSEHTLTEFLQHSGRVLSDVEQGEIVLHRRDGEDLVVMTRGQSEAMSTVLRALAALAVGGESQVVAVLPWLAFLSPHDRATCLRELGEVANAAVATGRLSYLEDALYQWETTGLAAWDEQRLREREEYAEYTRDEPQALPRP
ncbi:MAG: hypothetical protein HY332_20565 [Chloroflexi bacterium]|nr:hypothetical protein [Chloroflexota bacterium]